MKKPGDKFIIEIEEVIPNKTGILYRVKGFRSLVFDQYGLIKLEEYNPECELSEALQFDLRDFLDEMAEKWIKQASIEQLIRSHGFYKVEEANDYAASQAGYYADIIAKEIKERASNEQELV